MNRRLLALSFICALSAACGRSSTAPSAPAPQSSVASAASGFNVVQSSASLTAGGAPNLGACLQSSGDSACFSATRLHKSAVSAAATAPGAPGNLTATVSGSTVTLVWTAPASGDPVISYVLEAGSSSGLANLANALTNSTATTYVAPGVGAGTYFVRVRAQNAAGVSSTSNEITVVVGSSACTSAPNPPSGLQTSASGSTVSLTWSPSIGGCAPTAYILQAGSAAGLSNLANSSTGNTSTSYIALGISNGTYFVRILAANAFGQSGASNESVLIVGPAGPTTLTILPASLPTLTVGVPVSITFSVVGGTGKGLIFDTGVGAQIPGLFINTPSPGMLSGTPTTAGPYLREFTVIDSAGNTGRITYTGTVNSK